MRVEISDRRSEHRVAHVRLGLDGERLPDREPDRYGGSHADDTSFEREDTSDRRIVEIWFEEGDEVPRVFDPNEYLHYGQVFPFFVRRAEIIYKRDNDVKYGGSIGPVWKRTKFRVFGINQRKDGSEGEKPQTQEFPTRSMYDTGEFWTEDDITVEPDHFLYQPQKDRVGKPKREDRHDPIPEWLAAIEVKVSPLTGVPYAHGEEHRFGVFPLPARVSPGE